MGDEAEAVEVVRQGEQVDVSIPGSSGHHQPGARADLVQGALDDQRVADAEHVNGAKTVGAAWARMGAFLDDLEQVLLAEDLVVTGVNGA